MSLSGESRFEAKPGQSIYGAAKELRQEGASIELNFQAKDAQSAIEILAPLCSEIYFNRLDGDTVMAQSIGDIGSFQLADDELLVATGTVGTQSQKWKTGVVRTKRDAKNFVSLTFVGRTKIDAMRPFLKQEDLKDKP